MVKSIDDCVKKAKFSKLNEKNHPYCPSNVEVECRYASDNNYVPDDNGELRPICKRYIEINKPDSEEIKGYSLFFSEKDWN